MSLTIQQIILDAKRLAGRLKERETEADALLTETQTAYRQIHTMKQVIIMEVCVQMMLSSLVHFSQKAELRACHLVR